MNHTATASAEYWKPVKTTASQIEPIDPYQTRSSHKEPASAMTRLKNSEISSAMLSQITILQVTDLESCMTQLFTSHSVSCLLPPSPRLSPLPISLAVFSGLISSRLSQLLPAITCEVDGKCFLGTRIEKSLTRSWKAPSQSLSLPPSSRALAYVLWKWCVWEY